MGNNKKKMLKAEAVLHWIAFHGVHGASYRDIQGFIFGMNHPGVMFGREHRGYWSTNLQHLLNKFCFKIPSGKWILTEPIAPPYFVGLSETMQANYDRRRGEWLTKREKGGRCQNCGDYLWTTLGPTPDKLAHYHQMQIGGGAFDCRGRVWNKKSLTTLSYADLNDFTADRKRIWSLTREQLDEAFDKFVTDREYAIVNRSIMNQVGNILHTK